jgi:hypothetical protein
MYFEAYSLLMRRLDLFRGGSIGAGVGQRQVLMCAGYFTIFGHPVSGPEGSVKVHSVRTMEYELEVGLKDLQVSGLLNVAQILELGCQMKVFIVLTLCRTL